MIKLVVTVSSLEFVTTFLDQQLCQVKYLERAFGQLLFGISHKGFVWVKGFLQAPTNTRKGVS